MGWRRLEKKHIMSPPPPPLSASDFRPWLGRVRAQRPPPPPTSMMREETISPDTVSCFCPAG